MNKLFAVVIIIANIYLAPAQSRVDNKHLILEYISEIDSIWGEIIEQFYPEMNVSFVPPFGCYDTSDYFIVSMKGYRPLLPFYYNIKGKSLLYGDDGFENIALRYRDTCYHKNRLFPWRGDIDDPIINDTLLEIHIICDQNYDSLHPKGQYLDDIVGISYNKHIMNPTKGYCLIKKPEIQLLSDYNMNYSHAFMLPRGYWGLLKPPDKIGEYSFKLIIINEKGKKYELNYKSVIMTTKISYLHGLNY